MPEKLQRCKNPVVLLPCFWAIFMAHAVKTITDLMHALLLQKLHIIAAYFPTAKFFHSCQLNCDTFAATTGQS